MTDPHANPAPINANLGPRQDAAAVAVQRLAQLVTGEKVNVSVAQDLLLAAASGARVSHLPALLAGLLDLAAAQPPSDGAAWAQHPLCRALHVGPCAAEAAVQAVVRALWARRGAATLRHTLHTLRPVLCCATCDPGLGPGPRSAATAALARLVAGLAGDPGAENLESATSLFCLLCRGLCVQVTREEPSLAPHLHPVLDAWQALRFELPGERGGS